MAASPRPLHIVGIRSSLGAPHGGPAAGPEALREWGLPAYLAQRGIPTHWDACPLCAAPRFTGTMAERMDQVGDLCRHLADQQAALTRSGAKCLILGGDHAIAAGTWRGVARALAPHGPLGLIWIDAHLDSHTPESTSSGNIHGMPLAALLGEGSAAMAGIPGPHLRPDQVCVVGARSWEGAELERLTRLGVRIFGMDEIHRRGLPAVLHEALARARHGTAGFGVSLDLDALEPTVITGTTCPEPGGLDPQELADALHLLRPCADLVALEIVEYVPDADPDRITARWVADLAAAALGGAPDHRPSPRVQGRGWPTRPSLCPPGAAPLPT